MIKQYDRRYFQYWYRDPTARIVDRGTLGRRVALALALAEFALDRPVRTVLDVGCGEGAWRAPLMRLRPKLKYLGLDASEYTIARFGRSRNLAHARFADLQQLRPCRPADLLICADVMHYLSAAELKRGIQGLADLCHGVAYIETYCRGDQIEGDTVGFLARNPSFYRGLMSGVGFQPYGPFAWLSPHLAESMVSLSLPAWAPSGT